MERYTAVMVEGLHTRCADFDSLEEAKTYCRFMIESTVETIITNSGLLSVGYAEDWDEDTKKFWDDTIDRFQFFVEDNSASDTSGVEYDRVIVWTPDEQERVERGIAHIDAILEAVAY